MTISSFAGGRPHGHTHDARALAQSRRPWQQPFFVARERTHHDHSPRAGPSVVRTDKKRSRDCREPRWSHRPDERSTRFSDDKNIGTTREKTLDHCCTTDGGPLKLFLLPPAAATTA
ncbi:unnamed protein product [Macrosiphum euphorbiae]|uniref:Uncharacterized protein n=1 Tax=Macrosiphum euphorbiae TaxID=13131 RepID=A0AAV0W766_9HEMI|nr:unnamed protein product [Macrosiphum euphorbiae]